MPAKSLGHLYRTARWQRLRAAQLAAEPLCALCLEGEIVTAANTVHHAEGGHGGDIEKFWSGPFASLCAPCHSRHGALEDRGKKAIRFGADGWPI